MCVLPKTASSYFKNKDKVFQGRMNISKEIRAKEKRKEGEKEKGGGKERPEGGRWAKERE